MGVPSSAGAESLSDEGALSPTAGGCAVVRLVGNIHDCNSVCQDMVDGLGSCVEAAME